LSSELQRRTLLRGAFVGLIGGALAGCGFQPQYRQRAAVGTAATDLSYVFVAPIGERSGQLVRNELIELFGVAQSVADQVYRLDVQLLESREGLAIEQDDTITRYNLRLAAAFSLQDRRDDADVLKGNTRAIAAYNVVESRYANLIAERDARARAARNVAENIRDQVAVYFDRRRA